MITVKHIKYVEDQEDKEDREALGIFDGFRVQTVIFLDYKEMLRVSTFGDYHVNFRRRSIGPDRWYETALMCDGEIEVLDGVHTDDLTGNRFGDNELAQQMHADMVTKQVNAIKQEVEHGNDASTIKAGLRASLTFA